MPSASECESAHGVISSPQWAATSREPASRAAPARSQARRSGAQPSACTASNLGPGSAAPRHAANAPPPTCTKIRSSVTPCAAHWSSISQPRVRPPSSASAFSGPCTVKGIDPAATASRNRNIAGSPAGSDGRRSQRWTRAPSRSSSEPNPSLIQVGTYTSIGQFAAAANVAAASAALPQDAIANGGRSVRCPSRAAAARCSRIVNRCRAFWLPATPPVSSFTQTPPPSVKPSASDNASDRPNGVGTNPTPATRRTVSSSSSTISRRVAASMPFASA